MNLLEITIMNIDADRAEAKELRARIERDRIEADRIAAELPDLEAEADRIAATRTAVEFQPTERAEQVTARLGWVANRLRQIETAREQDEARLRVLDSRIDAGPRADRAQEGLREAQDWLQAATRMHGTTAAAVEKLSAGQAAHTDGGKASQNSRIAALLASVGIKTGAAQAEPVDFDAGAHERRAHDIEQALGVATGKLEEVARDVEAAQQAVQLAEDELKAALADVAELEHANALEQYLPVLCRYIAAHTQAHKWRPDLPQLDVMIEDALPHAEAAFIASVTAEPARGVVAKATKAVKGLLS